MRSVPMDDMHPVIMELKDQSFGFVPLSWCFKAEILQDCELPLLTGPPHLKHHPFPYHVSVPHLIVTPGMSGFSAWFLLNAASCIPAEWMFHRHPHRELTQDDTELVLQRKLFYSKGRPRGEALLRGIGVNRGHKAAARRANIAVRRRGGSQDHYLWGLNFLFWHAQYIYKKGILETWGQWWRLGWLSTSIQCTVTWVYTQ